MYWITDYLGTASLKEINSLKKENVEIENVYEDFKGVLEKNRNIFI